MNGIALLVLVAWPLAVLGIFAIAKPRDAVLVSVLTGWLLLPETSVEVAGLPDIAKVTITSIAVLLGIMLFDPSTLLRFRPALLDIPMAVWCAAPFASSLGNDLGLYDAISSSATEVLTWGIPYLCGRMYLAGPASQSALLLAIVLGGLLYVPLCLYELRMSPQLHRMVYGVHQHAFGQAIRDDGYRPMVFLQHGLMVAMWMTSAALAATWIAVSRGGARICGIPAIAIAALLTAVAVSCKSLGALTLLLAGFVVIAAARTGAWRLVLGLLMLIPPVYLAARIGMDWNGREAVALAERVSADRAESLQVRLENEEILIDRALKRPLFGWGGWDRSRDEDVATITDSLWIVALGRRGLVGMVAGFAVILGPVIAMCRRGQRGSVGVSAPTTLLATLLVLHGIDCLANAMISPVLLLSAGAVAGSAILPGAVRRPQKAIREWSDARAHPGASCVPGVVEG